MRLLLISNTGRPPFGQSRTEVSAFLGASATAAFISAARISHEDDYFSDVERSLVRPDGSGIVKELRHLRWNACNIEILDEVSCVIVGGGNTFVLLDRLYQANLLEPLRQRISGGLSYIGSSAGANIAGPNVLTSNDWNVASMARFSSLGLVPFNINPHYAVRGGSENLESESRDDRVMEYHEFFSNPVAGLEEGAMLRIEGSQVTVAGRARVKIFQRDDSPRWYTPGSVLSGLL
jgi:dipeptidase E